jgi:pyruvate-formate lyase-activating enzyme
VWTSPGKYDLNVAVGLQKNHPMRVTDAKSPQLVVSDGKGQVFEIPHLLMSAMRLDQCLQPKTEECIPLPHGSSLFELPNRHPIGYDPLRREWTTITQYQGQPVYAVAAFLAPAFTQLYRAAFASAANAVRLPLFAYSAVGWRNGKFYTPAVRVDADIRQDIEQFDLRAINRRSTALLKKFPNNRLVVHLVHNCVRSYQCPAAQNWAMGRWEAPIPTSPTCNARCLGCISLQPDKAVSATQNRICFTPTVDEIVSYTVPHLEKAPRAVVSFGQGCEGEPLMQADLLEEAIRAIRKRTSKGIINLNTNAGRPHSVARLCQAGLDSIRVSMNSSQPDFYHRYFSPKGYDFNDVLHSISVMAAARRWISLNYFIFPGLTDHPDEIAQLLPLLKKLCVQCIQMRNLNIDPEWYIEHLQLYDMAPHALGIKKWMQIVKKNNPKLIFGYFNPPLEVMLKNGHQTG